MPLVEPFIRWAGGKSWLLQEVDNLLEKVEYKNYYEPFLGGGAVFFSRNHPKNCYLSDLNKELIDTYIAVRDRPNEVIRHFLTYENTEEDYYRIRELQSEDLVEKAAQFIFLNQTSYNGLYRVNRDGKYNVPYGNRKKWTYNCDRILFASQKLQKVKLKCSDFSYYKYRIKEKDLVFLDPPYTISDNNGFIMYNKELFSLDDQHRLSKFIDYIRKKGAYYILTNAAHPIIREIFMKDGDRVLELDRQSLIGGKCARRGRVSEFIFTNIPERGLAHDENEMG